MTGRTVKPKQVPPTDAYPGGGIITADGTVYMRKLVRKRILVKGKYETVSVPGPLKRIGNVREASP